MGEMILQMRQAVHLNSKISIFVILCNYWSTTEVPSSDKELNLSIREMTLHMQQAVYLYTKIRIVVIVCDYCATMEVPSSNEELIHRFEK